VVRARLPKRRRSSHDCIRQRPTVIVSMWASLMAALGVDTRFSTPGHAQSDGASERAIQSIRHMLWALGMDANSVGLLWKAMLPSVVVSYNPTPTPRRAAPLYTWQC
jgi:hypothetical protein